MKKERIVLMVISIGIALIGAGLVYIYSNAWVVVGIVMMTWANNLSKVKL